MATDIFVYDSIEEYQKHYPLGTTVFQETPVFDMYIKPPGKLWVITQTNVQKERPDLKRSIVHFRNGSVDKWLEGDEILLHQDNLRYDYKKKELVCGKYKIHVNRYIGDKIKYKYKLIDWIRSKKPFLYRYRFYDYSRDRLCLILDTGKSNSI